MHVILRLHALNYDELGKQLSNFTNRTKSTAFLDKAKKQLHKLMGYVHLLMQTQWGGRENLAETYVKQDTKPTKLFYTLPLV